jgi:hypothetical protein
MHQNRMELRTRISQAVAVVQYLGSGSSQAVAVAGSGASQPRPGRRPGDGPRCPGHIYSV